MVKSKQLLPWSIRRDEQQDARADKRHAVKKQNRRRATRLRRQRKGDRPCYR